jgi:hypothetical protein
MTQQHPITPPPELVQQWLEELYGGPVSVISPFDQRVLIAAAQWGADHELEACCEWLCRSGHQFAETYVAYLRAARRPKPPSLKEQALALVEQHEDGWRPSPKDWDTIRRALEQLPDSIVVFPSQC